MTSFSEKRGYKVQKVKDAKEISHQFLKEEIKLNLKISSFGLPEIDDRFDIWRVPIKLNDTKIGEIVINAKNGEINNSKTTDPQILIKRFSEVSKKSKKKKLKQKEIKISPLANTLIKGNSVEEIFKLPPESINLVFTSPPYYNAKPEYSEYSNYEEYLELMQKVINSCHAVLSEGRFFVLNISPILLRRASRNEASKRIAVPFDFHTLFIKAGFDFIDDIHWVKPDGAGWSFGRGRRFAADRNPLQYKPVPVTEYVLVYRKKTDRLIDWNIRNHPDQDAIRNSKIDDGYETTNLWKINPSRSKVHPATFPVELAENVIKYYSFENDVILDPFAGTGTTAKAAINLNRRFVMSEMEERYIEYMKAWMANHPRLEISSVKFINTQMPDKEQLNLSL